MIYKYDFMSILRRSFRESESISESTKTDDGTRDSFRTRDFFKKWFREYGKSYFFLFKKNLKVTNMQFAELLALVRKNTVIKEGEESIQDLQFLSSTQFNAAVREIVESFPRELDGESRHELVVKLYHPLLYRAVVLDPFYGSCALFMPPHLKIDLENICAFSGYIHSCGYNVFIRNMEKVKKGEFLDAVRTHLVSRQDDYACDLGKKYFNVYTSEDFSPHDRLYESELRDGLDDVKIYVEKFYMGSERLVSVLEDVKEKFEDTLEIPDPGDYRPQLESSRLRSIWMVRDHSITVCSGQAFQGNDRYFICYEQIYKNNNQFHIFDENKPAWMSHTTIPHTLMGSMINITRPWWDTTKPVLLADPFVGSGTTWFESLKFFPSSLGEPGVLVECGDKEPIAPLLAEDNLTIFSGSLEEIGAYTNHLFGLEKVLSEQLSIKVEPPWLANIALDPGQREGLERSYEWAKDFLERMSKQLVPEGLLTSPDEVRELAEAGIHKRLIFYVCLRVNQRHVSAFARGSINFETAFKRELNSLNSQLYRLLDIRKRQRDNIIAEKGPIVIYVDSYSLGCAISDKWMNHSKNLVGNPIRTFKTDDAAKIKENEFDVIITDPPYGFNTAEGVKGLAELYERAIKAMIRALRNDGQLVICLLDRSHTGRTTPAFTHKEIVIRQVVAFAEESGREVISAASTVPGPSELFRPPYYWESERALRRAILHFRIRSRLDR